MRLVDYKVRILTPQAGTAAVTRVMIESADAKGRRWSTVGVSPNIIDASFNALHDAITWKLYRDGATPLPSARPRAARPAGDAVTGRLRSPRVALARLAVSGTDSSKPS